MAYRFKIATDAAGVNYWEFTVNPTDISGLFQPRAYTSKSVLSGMPIRQFPRSNIDTRLRTLEFDGIPDSTQSLREFLIGSSDSDTTSLQYLKKLDSNGRLTVYYLMIPDGVEQYRPEGYRNISILPIQVEDVWNEPRKGPTGRPRWHCRMIFRIVPLHLAPYVFTLGTSQLDSQHTLGTGEFSKVYYYDLSGGTYTDYTTVAYTGGSPFPASIAKGDMFILGNTSKFYGAQFQMDTLETIAPDVVQGDTANLWEYYGGAVWATLATANDETVGFTKDNKYVSWTTASGWESISLSNAISGAPVTDDLYWARLTVGTVTTAWDIDKILKM